MFNRAYIDSLNARLDALKQAHERERAVWAKALSDAEARHERERRDERLYFAKEMSRERRSREATEEYCRRLTDRVLARQGVRPAATPLSTASETTTETPQPAFRSLRDYQAEMASKEDEYLRKVAATYQSDTGTS